MKKFVLSLFMFIALAFTSCTPTAMELTAWEANAGTIGGSCCWTSEHFTLSSVTDWEVWTAPSWARQCMALNEHASGVLYLGNYDETGTADVTDPTTQDYFRIAAGAAVSIPLSEGAPSPDAAHRALPFYSSTATLPVDVYCTASPE